MSDFILLHLANDNSTVCIAKDCIHLIIKDYPTVDKSKTNKNANIQQTCIYFKNQDNIRRIFVNESVERIYNMLLKPVDITENIKQS